MKKMRYKTTAGLHISRACSEASALSKSENGLVRFDFNGVKLVASPKKSTATLIWEFDFTMARQSAPYKTSQAYVDSQNRDRVKAIEINYEINRLVNLLDWSLQRMDLTIDWVRQFTPLADHVCAKYDKSALKRKLEQAGYKENAHVGRAREDFNDRKVTGEWIIGQVINCISSGIGPHPIAVNFCEKYFSLPSHAAKSQSDEHCKGTPVANG